MTVRYFYVLTLYLLYMLQNRELRKERVLCVRALRCCSIKFQTKHIGAVKAMTNPFFLEGVIYIKRTSHVSKSVST